MPEETNDVHPTEDYAGAFDEYGKPFRFAGRDWLARLLDVDDLILLQQRVPGGWRKLRYDDAEHIKLYFWLLLRKSDPSLTPDQLERGEYTLTEQAAGRLITLREIVDPRTTAIMRDSFFRAMPRELQEAAEGAEPDADGGNAGGETTATAGATP